jgi:hypothetical protein
MLWWWRAEGETRSRDRVPNRACHHTTRSVWPTCPNLQHSRLPTYPIQYECIHSTNITFQNTFKGILLHRMGSTPVLHSLHKIIFPSTIRLAVSFQVSF